MWRWQLTRLRSPHGMPVSSRPSKKTRPVSGRSSPMMSRAIVVFPDPLPPISPTTSPYRTSKLTLSTARILDREPNQPDRKDLRIPSILSSAPS